MKEKILFVTNDLGSGGAEKSLVSLLSQINYKKYEVDLLRLGEGDFFSNSLPKEVKILNVKNDSHIFLYKPAKIGMKMLFKQKKYIAGTFLLISQLIYRLFSNIFNLNGKIAKWKIISQFIPKITKKYDVAVAYNFDYPIHYIVDKIESNKKIGWIHGNYKLTKSIPSFDKRYFSKLDSIVTVSKTCQEILVSIFPQFIDKILVIENINSPLLINQMAAQEQFDSKVCNEQITLVTVARLSPEKGVDIAIKALKLLKDDGYNIKWIIIGEGQERQRLEELIKDLNLKKEFLLIGEKSNPYSVIKNSDIYVQPSLTEGKSIALEEAKILGRPIVVTNYSTVDDQIKNLQNGLIVPISPVGVYEGVKNLIDSPELRNKFSKELLRNVKGNESEIIKFYEIITK